MENKTDFDNKLAIEILARFTGNSRGTPIAKKAFVDGALWAAQFHKQEQKEGWEAEAKKALDEIHKHTTLCADEHEENIFNMGFFSAYAFHKQETAEPVYTYEQLIEIIGAYSVSKDLTVSEAKKEYPKVFKHHCEVAKKWLKIPVVQDTQEKPDSLLKGLYRKPFVYDEHGQMIFDANNNHAIDIRGWGRIQYMGEKAMQKQDAFGRYVTKLLNDHWPE